jgi:hypothetical protein
MSLASRQWLGHAYAYAHEQFSTRWLLRAETVRSRNRIGIDKICCKEQRNFRPHSTPGNYETSVYNINMIFEKISIE